MSVLLIVTLGIDGRLIDRPSSLWGQELNQNRRPDESIVENLDNPFPDRRPAPDLDGGVEWLNSGGPISLKELRGKIVLIDFWTFCCINCMHVLPDLAYLERKYSNELVVIGVHSAKFDSEKETGNIRQAILRYEIAHPVINDANMTIWRKFGANSWPTLVIIDPEGQYCGYVPGEGNRELLEKVIERLIEFHKKKGTLDQTPVHFALERDRTKETPLRFPGKIVVDRPNNRLFISDSNHNRIVLCTLDGTLLDVIGTGFVGHKDGSYQEAEFHHPQGMAIVGNLLYVADTENHILRTVDLSQKAVSTLAGIGVQNRLRTPGGALLETGLNSPWDLTVIDDVLYIAMAGPHQIWSHKLGSRSIQQYAGSGKEDIIDGDLQQAALAQTSGIVNDGNILYVVDSEGSAVRKITTSPKNNLAHPSGHVSTIVGAHDLARGRSLFEFGDVDGHGQNVRLQHPLGLAIQENVVYVADSYNHKIKRLDPNTQEVTTWLGVGTSGANLSPLQLAEPAGLAISNGQMFIADTNNHRIIVVDMATKDAREMAISGLNPPPKSDVESQEDNSNLMNMVSIETQELRSGDSIRFEIVFELADGYKLNELMPVAYRFEVEDDSTLFDAEQLKRKHVAKSDATIARFEVPTANRTGKSTILLTLTYGYCRVGRDGFCKFATHTWRIPCDLKDDAVQQCVNLRAVAK